MIISYSLDNELIFDKELKCKGILKFTGKLVVITLIALSFGNTITYAATPLYNSPNYLKAQMVLFLLERLKAEELNNSFRWWIDDIPRETIKTIRKLL